MAFITEFLEILVAAAMVLVTGMAGMRPAILDQQQIAVHHERRRRKVQQEDFIGEGEKLPAFRR